MKKILSIIVLTAITINMLLYVVSAEGEALTYTQTEKLLIDSYERASTVTSNYYFTHSADSLSSWWTDSDEMVFMCPISIDYDSECKKIIYKNSKGEEQSVSYNRCHTTESFDPLNRGWGFLKFKSIDDVRSYLSEVFTSDLAERFFTHNNTELAFKYGYNDIKTFIEDDEGNLFTILDIPPTWRYDLYRIKSFSSTESYATMTVYTIVSRVDDPLYSEETVEFTNTSNGWRASGGSLFDILTGDSKPNYAEIPENSVPQTSDPSSIAIPALTAAAVISLAVPMGIVRRRRRYA